MNIRHFLVRNFLVLGCFSTCLNAFSQASSPDQQIASLRNVVPPSPNASSLGKYGDWPVSLYTGVPNISVPVYELKGRTMTIPISLSYHASGNKVGEIASWVGLGWSLNAGGVITRSVRGLPDEEDYFTQAANFSDPNNLSSPPVNLATWNNLVVGSAKNISDSQEDIYNLNAMGHSVKLILKADGSVQTIPYSLLKVTSNPIVGPGKAVNGWTVLLEDGTKLVFGGSNSYNEITNNLRFKAADGTGVQFTSSWYLQSVTSPSNEIITFSYTVGATAIEQDSYYSESDNIEYRNSFYVGPNSCSLVNESTGTTTTVEKQTVSALNLSSIESDLGRVDFLINAAERLDLPGGHALQEIKVFSKKDNKYVADFIINTGYSQSVSGNEITNGLTNINFYHNRLRLVSFEKKNLTDIGVLNQKWSFDYNPQNLPSRHSYAQDHWGFFNGATSNNTLLPSEYFVIPSSVASTLGTNPKLYGFMSPNHKLGANREGDGIYMQAEILTGIHYPTGGYSNFAYEPNTVAVTEEKFSSSNLALNYYVSGGGTFSNSLSTTFTITKPQYVNLTAAVAITASVLNDRPGTIGAARILDQSGAVVVSVVGNGNKWFNMLAAGTYTFQAWSNVDPGSLFTPQDNVSVNASLTYQQSNGNQAYNKCVGGLRINNIVDYDGNNSYNKRYFLYDSSLIINPVDAQSDYLTTQTKQTYNQANGETCTFIVTTRNSSSRFSLGSIQGGTIGYSKVTTLNGQNGENGRTISIFSNVPDNGTSVTNVFPFPPTDSKEHRRGLLLSERQYNAAQILLQRTDNYYSFPFVSSVTGFKAGYVNNMDPYFCSNQYLNCGINQGFFTMTCEKVIHDSTKQLIFDNAGLNSLSTITKYYYDNPLNPSPTRIETTDSKQKLMKSITRTALEKADINAATPLSATASAAIDQMLARNILTPVLQSERYNGSQLMSRSLTNYKLWPNNIILPENIQLQLGANPIETRVQFYQYDAAGNLSEQSKSNDVHEVYLYGYKNRYPVAKVTGSDLATVSGYVNQVVLDNINGTYTDQQVRDELNKIRKGLANTKALVTTYTYAPLIGMVSETDPAGKTTFYEYDGFNRLKNIKDYQGNIVKNFQYNYQNSCGANCVVLTLQTFTGYSTPGYPVGVFNGGKQYIGIANTASEYVTLWNSNPSNQAIGVLSAGTDPLHFNLNLATNATPPPVVFGLRFYQWVGFVCNGVTIGSDALSYIDWGDGSKELLSNQRTLQGINDVVYYSPLRKGEVMFYWNYKSHSYPSSIPRTLTVFHNETTEAVSFTGTDNPSYSPNIIGNYPEHVKSIAYNSISNSSDLGILNFNSLKDVVHCQYKFSTTPTRHNNWQTINNFHNIKWLSLISQYSSEIAGNFRVNFPDLHFLELQSFRPDITGIWSGTGFPNLFEVVINVGAGNNPITSAEIDAMIIKQDADGGTITNGYMGFPSPQPVRSTASNAAYNSLISKGWILNVVNP